MKTKTLSNVTQFRGIRYNPKLKVWTSSFSFSGKIFYLTSASSEVLCACLRHQILDLLKGSGVLPEDRYNQLADPIFLEKMGEGSSMLDSFYRHQWFRDRARERAEALRELLKARVAGDFYAAAGSSRSASNKLYTLLEEFKATHDAQVAAILKQLKILEEKTGFKVGD